MDPIFSASLAVMYCAAKCAQGLLAKLQAKEVQGDVEIIGFLLWLILVVKKEAEVVMNECEDESYDWRDAIAIVGYIRQRSNGNGADCLQIAKAKIDSLVENLEAEKLKEEMNAVKIDTSPSVGYTNS